MHPRIKPDHNPIVTNTTILSNIIRNVIYAIFMFIQ